jgi:uncharacterized protein
MDATLFAAGMTVFISHALETVTGFGCTVMALPFITLLLGIHRAKILLAIMAWMLSLYIVSRNFRQIDFKQFFIIVFLAGSAMPLGIAFFHHFSPVVLKLALGLFIVLTAAFQLKKIYRPAKGGWRLSPRLHYVLLLCGGLVHGAFASGGPFVVLYAARKLADKGHFRATLSLLWLSLNTILFVSDASFHPALRGISDFFGSGSGMTAEVFQLACLLPFLGLGVAAGEFIHHRVAADRFQKMVFWVLLATGVFMVVGR